MKFTPHKKHLQVDKVGGAAAAAAPGVKTADGRTIQIVDERGHIIAGSWQHT